MIKRDEGFFLCLMLSIAHFILTHMYKMRNGRYAYVYTRRQIAEMPFTA